MRKEFAAAFLATLFLCVNAQASDAAGEHSPQAVQRADLVGEGDILGRKVLIYDIGTVTSNAETVDQFAIEVGTELSAYTAQTDFEACAIICRAPDTNLWGARMITVESHAFCPTTELCPAGMKAVGRDIHSHIHATRYRPTELDKLVLSGRYEKNEFVFTHDDWFSDGDFAQPGGYVIGKNVLLYQEGRRKVSNIWKVKTGMTFSTGFQVKRTSTFDAALAMHAKPSADASTVVTGASP